MFTPSSRRRGLPIGNQTSQFFGNVYLNGLDHFVLRELKPGRYLRYVDDFVLFGDDKPTLRAMRARIQTFLDTCRLSLHDRKSRVYACAEGLTFLGWRLLPHQARIARPNVVRMRRRLRKMQELYHDGRIGFEDIRCRVQSWIGHAAFGDTWQLRTQLFDSCILNAAEHGRNARRLLEQQSTERPRVAP